MPVVEIAYNPNDFYYVSSGKYDDIKDVCPAYLSNKPLWESDCCIDKPDKSTCPNWNKTKCYEYEVCKNKEYADLVNNLENNNGGTDERLRNLQSQYQNEVMKTINISAGVLLIAYLSVYFFKA
uniref:Uncharacterized protein n=1 Tax=viral metagenome TaxID=1070528 RepID=A0A6C0JY14_9ZZZZ